MNLLVVGNGGREHALAWRLAQSDRVQTVFVAPGNAGTATEPKLENVAITDIHALIEFVKTHDVNFTLVGPEAPLAAGIVNAFRTEGLPIFGPTREAAQLESSKDFAKAFMSATVSQPPTMKRLLTLSWLTNTLLEREPLSLSKLMVWLRVRGL